MEQSALPPSVYEVLRTRCPHCGHCVSAINERALFAGFLDHQERCPRG